MAEFSPLVPPENQPPFPEEPTYSFPMGLPEPIIRFHRIRLELQTQSDRGAAILGGAYVESILEGAIKARLIDLKINEGQTLFGRLFTGYGPLATFSAKIDVGFSLQLIGEHSYADLNIIRRIRNDFAHDLEVGTPDKSLTFQSRSIADRCNNLWLPKNDFDLENKKWLQFENRLDVPRGQYIYTIFNLSFLISQTMGYWLSEGKPQSLV